MQNSISASPAPVPAGGEATSYNASVATMPQTRQLNRFLAGRWAPTSRLDAAMAVAE